MELIPDALLALMRRLSLSDKPGNGNHTHTDCHFINNIIFTFSYLHTKPKAVDIVYPLIKCTVQWQYTLCCHGNDRFWMYTSLSFNRAYNHCQLVYMLVIYLLMFGSLFVIYIPWASGSREIISQNKLLTSRCICYSYTIGASGLPDIHEWFSLR